MPSSLAVCQGQAQIGLPFVHVQCWWHLLHPFRGDSSQGHTV